VAAVLSTRDILLCTRPLDNIHPVRGERRHLTTTPQNLREWAQRKESNRIAAKHKRWKATGNTAKHTTARRTGHSSPWLWTQQIDYDEEGRVYASSATSTSVTLRSSSHFHIEYTTTKSSEKQTEDAKQKIYNSRYKSAYSNTAND
jgi:hypothetical protein